VITNLSCHMGSLSISNIGLQVQCFWYPKFRPFFITHFIAVVSTFHDSFRRTGMRPRGFPHSQLSHAVHHIKVRQTVFVIYGKRIFFSHLIFSFLLLKDLVFYYNNFSCYLCLPKLFFLLLVFHINSWKQIRVLH
jgi:hypothetical protein